MLEALYPVRRVKSKKKSYETFLHIGQVRVVLDWTLALFFKRDIVSLGSLQRPREEFSEASR